MGVLGPETLAKLSQGENPIVENLSVRDLKSPEGAGYDFRVAEVFKLTGGAYLGTEQREIAPVESIAVYDPNKKEEQTVMLEPGKVYILRTIEKVNMPLDVTANVTLRRTGYSAGLILSGGNVAPGYSGELSVSIHNPSEFGFKLALGSRLLFVMFQTVDGATEYKGQWQNNDMLRKGPETQI